MSQALICIKCNTEFTSKRSDARYCSPLCRKKASRDVTDKLSVTEKPLSVTKEPLTVTKPVTLNVTLKEPVIPETPVRKEYKGKFPPFDFCPKHSVFYSSCHCGE